MKQYDRSQLIMTRYSNELTSIVPYSDLFFCLPFLQIEYAALDAAVLLKLFDCLLSSPISALSYIKDLFSKVRGTSF